MANKYIETKMDSEEGVTYSPSDIGENWVFTGDANNTTAHLNRLNRIKGKKSFKILAGIADHFSSWVNLTFKELLKIINNPYSDRTRRYANCEVTLTFHVSHDDSMSQHYISIWPTQKRDENKNSENNWGEEE
jgi:hypothetical protein